MRPHILFTPPLPAQIVLLYCAIGEYLISVICTCVAAQEEEVKVDRKPGNCPTVQNLQDIECPTAENLATECLLDKDCNGTQKCCSDGCSMKCLAAEAIPTPAIVIGPKGARGEKGDPVGLIWCNLSTLESLDIQAFVCQRSSQYSIGCTCLNFKPTLEEMSASVIDCTPRFWEAY